MIGLAHHNVAVVSVILDRKKYWSHTIVKSDPDWIKQLRIFLGREDFSARKRIIMFDDVSFMRRLRSELESPSIQGTPLAHAADRSIFLLFDTPENLSSVEDLTIVDASLEGDSWRYHKILPLKLNELIGESSLGLSVVKQIQKKETEPSASATEVSSLEESLDPDLPVFDPSKVLYFQYIEDCLSSVVDEQKRQSLRKLIAAWHAGSLSSDYEEKIQKRMEKLGVDVFSYMSWSTQASKIGYTDRLRKASKEASLNPSKNLKDISHSYNVRVGDLKWINQNWPFTNLTAETAAGSPA